MCFVVGSTELDLVKWGASKRKVETSWGMSRDKLSGGETGEGGQ